MGMQRSLSSFLDRHGARREGGPAPAGAHPSRNQPEAPASAATAAAPGIRIGGAEADLAEGRIRAPDGTVTELRPQSAAVLRALAARRGETVRKDDLHAAVWGDIAVTDDSLVQCVADIRRALGAARDALQTLPKRGYRLEAETTAPRRPARLLAAAMVATLAALLWIGRERPEPVRGPVVAVLPFENLAGGERYDRLARGLTEETIGDLAQNAWLFVLADAATRPLAGAAPQEVAARLGAAHVVQGSLQAEDGTVHIAAALVDSATGRQIWTKRWEGPEADLLKLQRDASEALTGELAADWSGPIVDADRAKALKRGTLNLAAYELYALGAERVHRFTREDVAAGEQLLRRAVALDPNYGEAWAKLSVALINEIWPETPPEEARRIRAEADATALEAYRVAPDSPMALGIAASVVRKTDPDEAVRMIRRRAELAPSNADILAFLGWHAAFLPELAPDAERWLRRAYELNPDPPLWYKVHLGIALVALGRYAEADEVFTGITGSDYVDVHAGRTASRALAGDLDGAKRAAAELMRAEPDFTIPWYVVEWYGFHPTVGDTYARGLRLAGAPER
jgi:TolB-like protein/DNA-binding winged helix-turn-helix (wHTH) protein